jgi:tetratricopeptide (TPR) repeat protein
VPTDLAPEAHRFAGELAMELARYTTAQRHLKAAAALEPEHARTRFLLGRVWEEDPDGCDRRAAICFKKAVALDAANPLYRAAFGRAAARCGKVKFGTREMLAATGTAGTAGDMTVVRIAVGGLLEVGQIAAARRVLAKARFLCPGNNELVALWERVKFESARSAQRKLVKTEKMQTNTRYAQDAQLARDGDRVTLPFAPGTGAKGDGPKSGGTVRRDGPSFPRPHLARLRTSRADR